MLIDNRREHIRMSAMIPCSLQTASGESWGSILDFSSSGLQLKSYFPFFPDQVAWVSFSVNKKFEFQQLEGRVVWIEKQGEYNRAGIRFEEECDREQVLKMMRYLVDPDYFEEKPWAKNS